MAPKVWSPVGKASCWPHTQSIDIESPELDPKTHILLISIAILMPLNLDNHCLGVWGQFFSVTQHGLRNSLTGAEGQ